MFRRRRRRVDAVGQFFFVVLLRLRRHLVEAEVVVEVDGGQSVQSHVVDKLEVSMSDKIAL